MNHENRLLRHVDSFRQEHGTPKYRQRPTRFELPTGERPTRGAVEPSDDLRRLGAYHVSGSYSILAPPVGSPGPCCLQFRRGLSHERRARPPHFAKCAKQVL